VSLYKLIYQKSYLPQFNGLNLLRWIGFVLTSSIVLLIHFFGYHYLIWLIPFLSLYRSPTLLRFYSFASGVILTLMLLTFIMYENSYGLLYDYIHIVGDLTIEKAYLGLFLLSHVLISFLILYMAFHMYVLDGRENNQPL
jgi:hypothetical protein